jgi:hypothetical protein
MIRVTLRLGLLMVLSFPCRGLADEPDAARARALKLGADGAAAYRAEHYAEALARFSEAYRTFPAAPLLLNISRAELKLGRCEEAIRYAEQFLAVRRSEAASPDAPDDWLATVRRSCIEAEITSTPPGASIWIDGERQTSPESTPWSGRVTVGPHKVLLWKSGYQKAEGALVVTADAPAHLSLSLSSSTPSPSPEAVAPTVVTAPPPASPSTATPSAPVTTPPPVSRNVRRLRWEPFIPAGVAVVGLALAIAGGVLSGQCPTTVGPATDVYAAEVCQYNRAGLADFGWGLAGAGAVTAGVLWLVLKPQTTTSQETPPVRVGFLGNGAFVAGRF